MQLFTKYTKNFKFGLKESLMDYILLSFVNYFNILLFLKMSFLKYYMFELIIDTHNYMVNFINVTKHQNIYGPCNKTHEVSNFLNV